MKSQSKFSNKSKASNNKAKGNSGEIRIIGGQWRGRKLKVHDKEGLRPTTDRLKETLFNWLMMDIRNAKVLDCFCGAGSLSFEAASRGAQHVTCIEKDKQAASQLTQNAMTLHAQSLFTLLQGDFFVQVKQLNNAFDVIFIDPPFHQGMIENTLLELIKNNVLKTGSIVYVEQESSGSFDLSNSSLSSQFELTKEKKAGQVLAQLFTFI